MITLSEENAVVVLDILEALNGPMSDDQFVYVLRMARVALPALEAAWDEIGIDPETVERPEIPLLKPGSKAKRSSS